MDSKKTKEIKSALQGLIKQDIYINEYVVSPKDILTLINDLEQCAEKWQKDCAEEVALNKPLKERINELENGIAQSMLGCEFLPECTNEKLKQFAERLKEKIYGYIPEYVKQLEEGFNFHGTAYLIDETLKEFINE